MSVPVKLSDLTDDEKERIDSDLQVHIVPKIGKPKLLIAYDIVEPFVYLPFAYAYANGYSCSNSQKIKEDTFFHLRPEQIIVEDEALSILSEQKSVIISTYTGFGKTVIAIDIAKKLGYKTLIIVNKIILMNQWKKSIEKFLSATSQILKCKEPIDDTVDFYIVNAINVPKLKRSSLVNIKTVIVDECHLIMAETLSKSLHYVNPDFLIGLSATPYRLDGLNSLLTFYFGEKCVDRKMKRKHIVYRVNTGFKPTVETGSNGKIVWNSVLESQARDDSRNQLIIKLTQSLFLDKSTKPYILILIKRIEHGELLFHKLNEVGIKAETLFGKKQTYDDTVQVLIGSTQKTGTGFDFPKLNVLLLATDVQDYFIQILGRIFRDQYSIPIIFDLVDDHPILKSHYTSRKKVYMEIGGEISLFKN
jgi:superfamily II DNA or RNA helicase